MTLLLRLLDPVVILAIIASLAIGGGAGYTKGRWDAYQAGKVDALKQSVEATKQREANTAAVRGKSDVDLCIELSGDRDACVSGFSSPSR